MIDEPKTDSAGAHATDVVAEAPLTAGSGQLKIEHGSAIPADELARLSDEIVGALKTVYDPRIPRRHLPGSACSTRSMSTTTASSKSK